MSDGNDTGFLVLTRKVGEAIKIGKDITVQVGRIDRDQVKLLFRAPKEIAIARTELLPRQQGQGSQVNKTLRAVRAAERRL